MIDPDRVIGEALNSQVLPAYNWFFSTITWLGSASLWLLILTGCIVINRWRKIASLLFLVLVFSMIITEDIKEVVQRIRPGDVVVAGYFVVHSYSFPSGHAQTAFVIATFLSAFLARRYNVITFLMAAAVGMSRIYLGVHFFTDVLAGAAIGFIVGMLAIFCLEKLGLYDGDGLFKISPRSKGKIPGAGWHDTKGIKFTALILLGGFLAANVAFYLSEYVLSLAVIGIMYIILLFLPRILKDRTKTNY
jgi:undecaprenyl-diphosphatase